MSEQMQQIKVLQPFNTHNGQSYHRDKQYTVSQELAKQLIEANLAESCEPADMVAEILKENASGVWAGPDTPAAFVAAMREREVSVLDESAAADEE